MNNDKSNFGYHQTNPSHGWSFVPPRQTQGAGLVRQSSFAVRENQNVLRPVARPNGRIQDLCQMVDDCKSKCVSARDTYEDMQRDLDDAPPESQAKIEKLEHEIARAQDELYYWIDAWDEATKCLLSALHFTGNVRERDDQQVMPDPKWKVQPLNPTQLRFELKENGMGQEGSSDSLEATDKEMLLDEDLD